MDFGGDNELGSEASVGVNNTGTVSASAIPADRLNPNIVVYLKPGKITQGPLGVKTLAPKYPDMISDEDKKKTDPAELDEWTRLGEGGTLHRVMQIDDSHVEVNGCGGPVFVRLRATAQINTAQGITAESIDRVDVYSDIVPL